MALLLKHLVICEQVCRYAANYMVLPCHNIILPFIPNAGEIGFKSNKYVIK